MTKQNHQIKKRRQRIRQNQTKSLRKAAVSTAANKRYERAVSQFFAYIRHLTHKPAAQALQQPIDIDLCLCDFSQHLWENEASKTTANSTVAGLLHLIPPLHNLLPGAKRLMKSWTRQETPIRATPLNTRQVRAIAGAAVSQHRFKLAIGILMSYHLMLRPIEILNVQKKHLRLSGTRRAVLLLLWTKTGKRMNASAEAVILRDGVLIRAIRKMLQGMHDEDYLM